MHTNSSLISGDKEKIMISDGVASNADKGGEKVGKEDIKPENNNKLKQYLRSFANKCKKPNAQMIKCSLVCGLIGTAMFFIGFMMLLNGLVTYLRDKKLAKQKIREAKVVMYHNLVPLIEVLLMLGLIFLVHASVSHKLTSKTNVFFMIAGCVFLCLVLMFFICLSLRMLGLREERCQSLNVKASLNSDDILTFPFFEVKKDPSHVYYSFVQSVIDAIFGKLMAPFFILIGVMQILSVPFRMVVDAVCKVKNADVDVLQLNRIFFRDHIKVNLAAAYHLFFYIPLKKDVFNLDETSCMHVAGSSYFKEPNPNDNSYLNPFYDGGDISGYDIPPTDSSTAGVFYTSLSDSTRQAKGPCC